MSVGFYNWQGTVRTTGSFYSCSIMIPNSIIQYRTFYCTVPSHTRSSCWHYDVKLVPTEKCVCAGN